MVHEFLFALLFGLLGEAVLLSALLSDLLAHNLSALLRGDLLLGIGKLLLANLGFLLVLALELVEVVLLVDGLDFDDFLGLEPRLLHLLENALLFVLEQRDPVLDLDLVVGQVGEARVDIEHALVLLARLVLRH